jgi:hypothetical protein
MTRFEFSLLGYTWSQPPGEADETIVLPSGWIESMSPFIPGVGGLIVDEELLFTALPLGLASDMARGFDRPDERLRWFLRQRPIVDSVP